VDVTHLNECVEGFWKDRQEKRDLRWLLLPDVDEFAYAKDENIPTLVEALNANYKGVGCVNIYRTNFGSSFWLRRPTSGLMIENYVLAGKSFRQRSPKKLIINLWPTDTTQAVMDVLSPYRSTGDINCIDDEGKVLQMNQVRPQRRLQGVNSEH